MIGAHNTPKWENVLILGIGGGLAGFSLESNTISTRRGALDFMM